MLAWQDPATSSARHARLQICTSFIRIAKAADKSILPHMKVSYFSLFLALSVYTQANVDRVEQHVAWTIQFIAIQ